MVVTAGVTAQADSIAATAATRTSRCIGLTFVDEALTIDEANWLIFGKRSAGRVPS
jgi:hypothetical protein